LHSVHSCRARQAASLASSHVVTSFKTRPARRLHAKLIPSAAAPIATSTRAVRKGAWIGIDMSGWRPLIKGYFAVLRLIVGAVMSSAC
jgi:hypothetical protein